MRTRFKWLPGLLLLVSLSACGSAEKQPPGSVVYLVRQAEPDSAAGKTVLSERGLDRSRALAHLLRDSGIQTVFAADSPRAQRTVATLADQLGLEFAPITGTAREMAQRIADEQGRCIVATDEDTLHKLVAELGGEPGPKLSDGEYDRIYVLIPVDGGVRTLLHRFGQPYQD